MCGLIAAWGGVEVADLASCFQAIQFRHEYIHQLLRAS
jgi:hypothetical protein